MQRICVPEVFTLTCTQCRSNKVVIIAWTTGKNWPEFNIDLEVKCLDCGNVEKSEVQD